MGKKVGVMMGDTVIYIHPGNRTPGGVQREHPAIVTAVRENADAPRVNLMLFLDGRAAAPKVDVQHQSTLTEEGAGEGATYRMRDEPLAFQKAKG
ncbi:MAG: hypothetical protein KIT73_01250 [Burkholderiales bacterium]|nr:hypothetical protein [Burkholderiales bacterium]